MQRLLAYIRGETGLSEVVFRPELVIRASCRPRDDHARRLYNQEEIANREMKPSGPKPGNCIAGKKGSKAGVAP